MTILFSNSSAKIPKSEAFGPIFEIDKLEDADLKYGNSILKIVAQKYSNTTFLSPNLGVFGFS